MNIHKSLLLDRNHHTQTHSHNVTQTHARALVTIKKKVVCARKVERFFCVNYIPTPFNIMSITKAAKYCL